MMYSYECTCSAGYGERHSYDCGARMKQRVDRPITVLAVEPGATICRRCGEPVAPGQLWLPERQQHVGCPSKNQIRRNRLWARARAILAARS